MITEKELIKKEFLAELKLEIQDIISEDKFREAYDLSRFLSASIESVKNFKDRNFNLYLDYKNLINKLSWVGLPIMIPDNIVKMFQYHFTVIFKIPEYDIRSKLKIVLLGIIILDERDKFKQQLREALQKNEEKITSKRLVVDNQKKDPTVANWLADYNGTLGTGQIKGLARTEYLVNGKNVKNLSEEEKKKTKLLFDLYERLKLSSQTFEGLENDISLDEDGAMGIIKEGIFEPFKETEKQKQTWRMIEDFLKERSGGSVKLNMKSSTDELVELRALAAGYPPGSFERKAVEEEIGKIEVRSKK